MIVGFVRDNQGPDEDTQGYTYAGAPVTIVTETDPDAGATVAHEIAHVQPHAPQVEILAPTADEVVDGEYMIVWEGSHADGAPLFYSVEYSDNGEDWSVLATEITATTWTEDFSLAPGSDETVARIRVTATDGVNAVDAESELFNVPPKAPEVYIEEPLDGNHFGVDQRISFFGLGYDLQDEWLYEDIVKVLAGEYQRRSRAKKCAVMISWSSVSGMTASAPARSAVTVCSACALPVTATSGALLFARI